MKDEQQKFQSKAQLFALQVHAVWEKFENVVLFPFRKAAEWVGQTETFRQAGEAPVLKVVK